MQRRHILPIGIVILLGYGILGMRLFQIQILRHDEYLEMADSIRRRTAFSAAVRGRIVDRDGRLLASDAPVHDVLGTLEGIVRRGVIVERLARTLGESSAFPYGSRRLFQDLDLIFERHCANLGTTDAPDSIRWLGPFDRDSIAPLRRRLEDPDEQDRFRGLSISEESAAERSAAERDATAHDVTEHAVTEHDVTEHDAGSHIEIEPSELFHGMAGVRRLEQSISGAAAEPTVRGMKPWTNVAPLELVLRVEERYRDHRDPVRVIDRQIDRVERAITALDPDVENFEIDLSRLEKRLAGLRTSRNDPSDLSSIANRLWHEPFVLVERVPYAVAEKVASAPNDYPGLVIETRRERVTSAGPALANLVGRVQRPDARTHEDWRERAEPIVDSWYSRDGSLRGVKDPARFLTIRDVAHHSRDGVGVSGLERKFEDSLRGRPGARNLEVTVSGRRRKTPIWIADATPGSALRLTVDRALCDELYRAFEENVPAPEGGSALFADPRSGEILGWCTYPGLDPGRVFDTETEYRAFVESAPGYQLDRPIAAAIPPGSVFKIVGVVAGLASGAIDLTTPVTCEGFYDPTLDALRCRNHSLPRDLDVKDAIALSCNVFFYRLAGREPGAPTIIDWGRALGVWEPELIGAPRRPVAPVPQPPRSSPMTGIGRGFTTTAVGLLELAGRVARRGDSMPLRLTRDASARDRMAETASTDLGLPKELWKEIASGMQGAVDYGTARWKEVGLYPFDVAVKTGTATAGGRGSLINHAWLVGFAPFDDPDICFAICLERIEAHGGEACGPFVARILEWLSDHRRASYRYPDDVWSARHPERGRQK